MTAVAILALLLSIVAILMSFYAITRTTALDTLRKEAADRLVLLEKRLRGEAAGSAPTGS